MRKRTPTKLVKSGITMDRIATGILCALPLTEKGNYRYIQVISTYFTKWTESFAMPNMEAATVARIIVEEVVVRYGTPSIIHSDHGRQYESKLLRDVSCLTYKEDTYHPLPPTK